MTNSKLFESKNSIPGAAPIARMLALGREVCAEVRSILPEFINDPMKFEGMPSEVEQEKIAEIGLHDEQREKTMGVFFDDDDEAKELGKDLYTHFYETTDKILSTKIAACQEGAFVALRFLFEKIINNPPLSKILDAEIVDYANEERDHTFIRIFLKSDKNNTQDWEADEKELKNSVILDVWTNDVFPATQMETRLTNGNFGYYKKSDSFDNTQLTISNLFDSLQKLQVEGEVRMKK